MDTPPDKTEVLYEGQWLRLVRRGTWESCQRTHHRDGMAVQIIAVTPDDEVLFVEQPRVALEGRTIEMPAGLVGDNDGADTLESAAARELVEETGWQPGRVEVLTVGYTTPGMSNERIALVRALDLRRVGEGGGVDGEAITVHAVPRASAPAWLLEKAAEGYGIDLKVWAGLWMIEHEPDGSRRG